VIAPASHEDGEAAWSKHAYRVTESAYRIGLKSLARRHLELHDETDLDAMISAIVDELAPNLVDAVRGYEIDAEAAKPCNDPLSDLDAPRASSSGLACGPALGSGRLGLWPPRFFRAASGLAEHPRQRSAKANLSRRGNVLRCDCRHRQDGSDMQTLTHGAWRRPPHKIIEQTSELIKKITRHSRFSQSFARSELIGIGASIESKHLKE
jgi:hypothetical protein